MQHDPLEDEVGGFFLVGIPRLIKEIFETQVLQNVGTWQYNNTTRHLAKDIQ